MVVWSTAGVRRGAITAREVHSAQSAEEDSNPLDKWVFVLEVMQMQRRTW